MTIAFCDTETLGLDADEHPIWEVGLIIDDQEYEWQLPVTEREIALAHPKALEMTRFEERYDRARPFLASIADERRGLIQRIVEAIGNRHLVGAIPSFDEERLRRLAWKHGVDPRWHYHLVDVEALAIGWLAAQGTVIVPPWKSDQLTEALGLTVSDEDKHTALGDCRWAKAIYERIMGTS